jgi:hypothetical protein
LGTISLRRLYNGNLRRTPVIGIFSVAEVYEIRMLSYYPIK